jgi:hypothetical protein
MGLQIAITQTKLTHCGDNRRTTDTPPSTMKKVKGYGVTDRNLFCKFLVAKLLHHFWIKAKKKKFFEYLRPLLPP